MSKVWLLRTRGITLQTQSAPVAKPSKFSLLFGLLVLVLLGLNLRPLLTSVGPLTDELQTITGLSFSQVSLLTTLPILMIGLMALFAGRVTTALGYRQGIGLGLLILCAGFTARLFEPTSTSMITSALVGGVGIALLHIVIPELTKQQYLNRLGMVTGLWSAALMGGAALGAVATPWAANLLPERFQALGSWSLLAAIVLIIWYLPFNRTPVASIPPRHLLLRSHRYPRAWLLGIYFALVNAGYAGFIAWIAPFYGEFGWPAQKAGNLLALFSLVQVIGALLLPALSRTQDRRLWLTIAVLIQMTGFAGLSWFPTEAPWLWSALCGFGLGGAFPLCIVMALDHIDNPVQAGRLVSFMQGIGFMFASLMPLLTGWFRDVSGNYSLGWQLHIIVGILIVLITWQFNPSSYRDLFNLRE
ncbi:CynX/NimT family MFS transporter [Idiomarina sp. PL1-037]|uniref:CynX/NimT family MFS transporter n=1 Tax=Idiomarina sp. PL1-037 TaxID=3095365 RepID=UPI002ACC2C8C|nr:CynX/NimT family MFS transporter [Idiomarina sp. PL1-037]WQC52793.1 CynX/NimT family MFS transporter [Idiomarina sp. PL1-037]